MQFTFLTAAGVVLFVRDDMEQGNWTQEEYTVNATFPYDAGKVIQRGQRITFRDPATNALEIFEVRNVTNIEPDAYQQIIAEHIVVSELSDDHIDQMEITNKTPKQALTSVLTGTLWSAGNTSVSDQSSVDISRGNVWQAVGAIMSNWNCYITPRVTFNAAGAITGRYLDITPAQGTWRGVRLSISKNVSDSSVVYDDSELYTALYGYGGSVEVTQTGQDDRTEELTFKDVVWSATSSHPAKPANQTYLEDPAKTALYGRNGRARFGYYQNSDITDANTLLEKTWETLKQVSNPTISITGTVTDLYRLGYTDQPLRLHDTAIVEIAETGEKFEKEIIKLDVDLLDPTATRVDIGDYIPNIIYINRSTETKANGGGGGGGRVGNGDKGEQYDTYSALEKRTDEYGSMIAMVVGRRNGDNYIKAGEIALSINSTTGESTAYINANHVNISATNTAYTLAGDLEHDADGKLIIKSAGGMYVRRTDQGITAQFGVWDQGNLTGLEVARLVNGETEAYLNADHINISGTQTVQTIAGAMERDAQGHLVIKEGAGLYAEHTESGSVAKFGVWDRGNLTGGVMCQQINGQTETYITGDHINISSNNTVQTIAGAMERDASGHLVIKEGAGLYAQHTVGGSTASFGVWDNGNITSGMIVSKINGETSATIKADYIDINGIVTELSTYDVQCDSITCTTESNFDGGINTTDISGDGAYFDTGSFSDFSCTDMEVNGDAVTWQSKTVRYCSLSGKHYFLYAADSTSQTPSGSAYGYVVSSYTDATIHYLGKADT